MKCDSCEEYDNCELAWKGEKDLKFCTNCKQKYTNEEWFCGLSTEEKAGFLDAIHTSYCVTGDWLHDEDVHGMTRKDWQEWLKQPHNSPK